MNKTTEALKLAEEALGNLIGWMDANKFVVLPKERKNLAAIREARAEHDLHDVRCECCGYMTHHREHMGCIRAAYAAPVSAKREWVDLTDDEIWEAVKNWNLKERVEGNYSLTRAVIAKFKEKNK